MGVAFVNHIFFSKNISIYAIFNDQSFNDTLTNDIISLEQLGPEVLRERLQHYASDIGYIFTQIIRTPLLLTILF